MSKRMTTKKPLRYVDLWGVRIFPEKAPDFLASGHHGVFNSFHRHNAVQFKRELRENGIDSPMKVVRIDLREVAAPKKG